MERNKRVYPGEPSGNVWVSRLLLFLSAAVVLSGLANRDNGDKVKIIPAPTSSAYVLEEVFDESPDERTIVLPASNWYALQLGAFESEESAAMTAQQYSQRGAAGYVWQDGRFRALAAVYPLKEDAQSVRTQLQAVHGVETYLYDVVFPATELRLTGMTGQLDALETAFSLLNDLAFELYDISLALDRQELNAEEVMERLNALGGQCELVALRLDQRFASPRHEAVSALMDCLNGFSAFVPTAVNTDGLVTLTSQIKYQTLSLLHGLKQIYGILSYT